MGTSASLEELRRLDDAHTAVSVNEAAAGGGHCLHEEEEGMAYPGSGAKMLPDPNDAHATPPPPPSAPDDVNTAMECEDEDAAASVEAVRASSQPVLSVEKRMAGLGMAASQVWGRAQFSYAFRTLMDVFVQEGEEAMGETAAITASDAALTDAPGIRGSLVCCSPS